MVTRVRKLQLKRYMQNEMQRERRLRRIPLEAQGLTPIAKQRYARCLKMLLGWWATMGLAPSCPEDVDGAVRAYIECQWAERGAAVCMQAYLRCANLCHAGPA